MVSWLSQNLTGTECAHQPVHVPIVPSAQVQLQRQREEQERQEQERQQQQQQWDLEREHERCLREEQWRAMDQETTDLPHKQRSLEERKRLLVRSSYDSYRAGPSVPSTDRVSTEPKRH